MTFGLLMYFDFPCDLYICIDDCESDLQGSPTQQQQSHLTQRRNSTSIIPRPPPNQVQNSTTFYSSSFLVFVELKREKWFCFNYHDSDFDL